MTVSAEQGVVMRALPTGYRFVGALSIAYALVMVTFLAQLATSPVPPPFPARPVEWFLAVTFALGPLVLLPAGVLLVTAKQPATLRRAGLLSAGAGVVLLLKALAVTIGVVQELTHPTDAQSGLVLVFVPMFIMPGSIWAVTLLATGALLVRHPRRRVSAE
ncbi:MAG: hypothetical protein K2X82_25270 [Gemmataceae bacterium]|nr:hypothetical protein [Gemmataceae bacterium]